jgi:hypothetical protein
MLTGPSGTAMRGKLGGARNARCIGASAQERRFSCEISREAAFPNLEKEPLGCSFLRRDPTVQSDTAALFGPGMNRPAPRCRLCCESYSTVPHSNTTQQNAKSRHGDHKDPQWRCTLAHPPKMWTGDVVLQKCKAPSAGQFLLHT